MSTASRDLREAASGPLASRLSPRYLEEHCLIPLGIDPDGALATAVGAPLDPTVSDELARIFKRPLRLVEVPASELIAAIMSSGRRSGETNGSSKDDVAPELPLDDLEALANQAPVIKLVNVLLLDALRLGASDVHVESLEDGLRVRYRIDGVLQDVSRLAAQYRAAVVSRVKIMAGLNIAERRLAQDGRARIRLADRDVDVRVSTLPALHGESIVLRILDHAGHGRGLAELGMPEEILRRFERMIGRSNGMVVVTGPTGSGKTTTLYAAVARVNSAGVKIVTVEDPVEYQIDGVIQIPVNAKAGFTFSGALRSILRHDPDVIMVGEMRDLATAEIATQAALTGHLVFSTLHTNDAVSAVTRLVDMGIEPYLVAATVQGIVAQRLVRRLCDSCAESYTPEGAELAGAPPPRIDDERPRFRRARGCDDCGQTGYRGRTGIYEVFQLGEKHRALIVRGATADELRSVARQDGFQSLSAAAWRAASTGVTSISELRRVTSEETVE